VPRSEEDVKLKVNWWNRAFVARQRPLRIKLVLTDVEDEECSLVLDYVCRVFAPSGADKDDLGFFYVDDPVFWERHGVHVAKGNTEGTVKIGNNELSLDRIKTIVYNALKTGESEIPLDKYYIGEEKNSGQLDAWSWKAWALVDLSCRRLYAFKILITQNLSGGQGYACLGYVACPEYGDFYKETRPVRYAVETVKFPELAPYVSQELILDDKFDDFVPEVPKPAVSAPAVAAPGAGSGGVPSQLVIPDELNQRLMSIDNSLSRLATSMEQLVEILKAK